MGQGRRGIGATRSIPKAVHWDGSAGKESVILQSISEGPAQTIELDPKQPMWIEVSR